MMAGRRVQGDCYQHYNRRDVRCLSIVGQRLYGWASLAVFAHAVDLCTCLYPFFVSFNFAGQSEPFQLVVLEGGRHSRSALFNVVPPEHSWSSGLQQWCSSQIGVVLGLLII
jgi:hypothetical protein